MAKKMKSTRKSITVGPAQSMIMALAENNIGVVSLLTEIAISDPMHFMPFLNMDDMNLRGEQIWVGFKYYAETLERFVECVQKRDPGMIARINEMCPRPPGEQAVESGASYARY